jgi:argininosuccinate lyase
MRFAIEEKSLYGKPHPRPCVSGIVMKDGKVLLTLRSEKVLFPKQWCAPGGHLVGGHDWTQTLKDEVLEEVGLTVLEYKLLGIYSDPKVNLLKDEKTGETLPFVVAAFVVTKFEGEVRINDESVEFGWFGKDDLPEAMLPPEKVKVLDAFQFQGKCFIR